MYAYKMKHHADRGFSREQNVFAEAEEEAKNNGLDPHSIIPLFVR